jgi:outer membrane protein OmpA-like peptidoglycan-associated protein
MNRSVSRKPATAIIFTFLILLPTLNAGAQVLFEYSHVEGDQWHLTSIVDEEVLINGELYYRTEILNKISVDVDEGSGGGGLLRNKYQIAEKSLDSDLYAWSAEYDVEYRRDKRGQLSGLGPESLVPTVRDVPVFPELELSPGATWSEGGIEVFDLRPAYGIDETVVIDFTADYEYKGSEMLEGRDMDRILINYAYIWNPDPETYRRLASYDVYPIEIDGEFRQVIWWDQIAGRNYAAAGRFSYTYFMSDGEAITFRGSSQGKAVYAEPMDKDALVKEFEDLTDDTVTARVTDAGVSVSLEDIHFVPDEPVMLPGEEQKLEYLSEILSRYPNRDILVIGHTAKVSSGGDGLLLSEQRSETVAQYLIDSGVRNRTQVMTRGMGHTQPVGDNSTEEGRRKNRRVEIIILEN